MCEELATMRQEGKELREETVLIRDGAREDRDDWRHVQESENQYGGGAVASWSNGEEDDDEDADSQWDEEETLATTEQIMAMRFGLNTDFNKYNSPKTP